VVIPFFKIFKEIYKEGVLIMRINENKKILYNTLLIVLVILSIIQIAPIKSSEEISNQPLRLA